MNPSADAGNTRPNILPLDAGAAPQVAPVAEPRPSLVIHDHELVRRIGRGAYGEVWLARNELGAYRAVKIVYRKDFEQNRPFEREFRGIQKFEPISRSHPGLVDVLQVGSRHECFYYVMELADPVTNPNFEIRDPKEARTPKSETLGANQPIRPSDLYLPHTLREDLHQNGRLPAARCIEIAQALASALGYLHQQGLVHRDVKPSNIIFVKGAPKLADIGLVTGAGDSQSIVGTEGYLPPEGPGTPRADIFSLGKVLYEIGTGQDRRQFPDLPNDIKEWPDAQLVLELNQVVLKACAGEVAQRYESAEDVLADLARLQQGGSVKRQRMWQYRLDTTRRTSLVVAALALAAASAILLWQRTGPSRSPAVPRVNEDGTPGSRSPKAGPTRQEGRRVAVWPFLSVGGGEESRGPAAQLTEEVHSKLGKIADLTVIDATLNSRKRRGQIQGTPEEWGWKHGVDAIIHGTIMTLGDKLQVRVKLTNVRTGEIQWSHEYTGTLSNIFEIQSQIALSIADILQIQVRASEKLSLDRPPTQNLKAYNLYGTAISVVDDGKPETLSRKIALFQSAIELDTNFTLAYLGLARAYVSKEKFSEPGRGWDTKALDAIGHVLESSPDLAETHVVRAELLYTPRRGWKASEAVRELRVAVELRPKLPDAHETLGFIYFHQGFLTEAVTELEKAMELAPNRADAQGFLGQAWLYQTNFVRAHEILGESAEDWNSILNLFYQGKFETSQSLLNSALSDTNVQPEFVSLNAVFLAAAGKTNEAKDRIERTLSLKERKATTSFHHATYQIAEAYALMNDKTNSLNMLRECVEDGFPCLPYFKNDPNLRNLSGWQPFKEFLIEQERNWKERKQQLFGSQ